MRRTTKPTLEEPCSAAPKGVNIGNLAHSVTEEAPKKAFKAYGRVGTANIIKDQHSNQSKGFGFVEMPNKAEARAAISGLNGKDLNGRTLTINETHPKVDKNRGCSAAEGGDTDNVTWALSFGFALKIPAGLCPRQMREGA